MNRDEDRAWAELLEAYHRTPTEPVEQTWPEAENLTEPDEQLDRPPDEPDPANAGSVPSGVPSLPRAFGPRDFAASDEPEDFVPPEPPPLPRGDRISRLAWTGALGSPAVLLLAAILSIRLPDVILTAIGLAFIAGCGTLLARMRDRDDDTGGAVL